MASNNNEVPVVGLTAAVPVKAGSVPASSTQQDNAHVKVIYPSKKSDQVADKNSNKSFGGNAAKVAPSSPARNFKGKRAERRAKGTHSQVGASAASSESNVIATHLNNNYHNNNVQLPVKNTKPQVISSENLTPVFGGYYALYEGEASSLDNKVINNIPHTEGQYEDGSLIYPENPHVISAQIRRNMFKTYGRTSGFRFRSCASLYASSRDITIVKELNPPAEFNFLYGVFSDKDFYTRAPELRRANLRQGDKKVDLPSASCDVLLASLREFESIYMGDVYQCPMLIPNLVRLLLTTDTMKCKEVVWFGHMMSTPIGYQGESGFFHFSNGNRVLSYPHRDPTSSDLYEHPPPFYGTSHGRGDLNCAVHDLDLMGTYITFTKDGPTSLVSALKLNRRKLGFNEEALWAVDVNGHENSKFYEYTRYAHKTATEFRFRADVPQSTALAMLQTSLLRNLGMDNLWKHSEAFPSAAEVKHKIIRSTMMKLRDIYNDRISEFRDAPPFEELNLRPWWQSLGSAVSSRATTIATTIAAVVGVTRALQGLRPGTIGYSLLCSILGDIPTDLWSICGAPVVEGILFSRLCYYMPPIVAGFVLAILDGLSHMNIGAFIFTLMMYVQKLIFLSVGAEPEDADRFVVICHTINNVAFVCAKYGTIALSMYPTLGLVLIFVAQVLMLANFMYAYIKITAATEKNPVMILDVFFRTITPINLGAARSEYDHVPVEVPKQVTINNETLEVSTTLLRDDRVEIDDFNKAALAMCLVNDLQEESLSSHKVQIFEDVPSLGTFKPPPRTAMSYAYAIEKRILSYRPLDSVVLKSDFLNQIKEDAVLTLTSDPVEVANSLTVEVIFNEIVKEFKPERRLTYQKWWHTMPTTTKVDFLNGAVNDESLRTRSLMLKLDEAQLECKPRCLINAHVGLSIFYKRYFDKIHGGLKQEPLFKEYTSQDAHGLRTLQVYTIFAAGLTLEKLCHDISDIQEKACKGITRIIACVAGDDTILFIEEDLTENGVQRWYFETDATAFDATQGRGLLDKELEVYESAGVPIDMLRAATYAPIDVTLDKYSKLQAPISFRLKVTGRATGFPNTSLGNSIVESLIVHECVLKVFTEACKENRTVIDYLDKTDAYIQRAKDLGIVLKKLCSTDVIEKASFLRGFFYYGDEGELRWAPAIGRLAKLTKTLADLCALYPKAASARELRSSYFYDVFYGLRTYDWPESMTLFNNMSKAPKLVIKAFDWNPSSLIPDEHLGQRYSLAVLERRYGLDSVSYMDDEGNEEISYPDSPDLDIADIKQLLPVLARFYRYDYR